MKYEVSIIINDEIKVTQHFSDKKSAEYVQAGAYLALLSAKIENSHVEIKEIN